MSAQNYFALSLCILALFVSVSASAQDKQISDAKTFADVAAYLKQETDKLGSNLSPQARNLVLAGILISAGDRLLEVAQDNLEKRSAYSWKLNACLYQIEAKVEGAQQKYDAILQELDAHEESSLRNFALTHRFNQFSTRAAKAEPTPENFEQFKTELKTWFDKKNYPVVQIASLGMRIAERNKVPNEQFVSELIEYIRSPEYAASTERKEELILSLEGLFRLKMGDDPRLYGRTLDDKEFKWADLRGKYVLIKFTATWCGPCAAEIPGMLEAYQKYHDKGFEIVSIYAGEREEDPVATVKKHVGDKKLPWIIISEELSKRVKHPEFAAAYGITAIPTMVLTDKEGKIIMMNARGNQLQAKLAEIFK
jgi:thiol-disulfide isomerase/thioredoxin